MSTSGVKLRFELEGRPLQFNTGKLHLDARIIECNSPKKGGYTLRAILPPGQSWPTRLEILIDGEELEPNKNIIGYWQWRPILGYAGIAHLSIQIDGGMPWEASIRVFPEKVTQERYEYMLNDISRTAVDLLLKLNSSINERAIIQHKEQESSALREYALLQKLIGELEQVMFHIRRRPHQVLKDSYEQQDIHHMRRISSESIPLAGAIHNLPAEAPIPHVPASWLERQNTTTYDVYENQFLKHFIQQQLYYKLNFVLSSASDELITKEQLLQDARARNWKDTVAIHQGDIVRLKAVIQGCQRMLQQCNAWVGEPFLQAVRQPPVIGQATQLLLKHQHYSRFFQLYLQFQEELRISVNTTSYITELSMQKVSEIYELWSVFSITASLIKQLIDAGFRVDEHHFFYEVKKDTFHFTVHKNQPGIILRKGNVQVEIIYEPLYRNFSNARIRSEELLGIDQAEHTAQLTPDMALEIYEQGQPREVLVFDVKYKWEIKKGGQHEPTQDDKDKMFKYHHYILRKTIDRRGRYQFEKVVSCAYILYPGDLTLQNASNPLELCL
ncbi:DUF2357 domain-containing protein [Dictyobacter kobayashii]|uniref:DUF2357 domain-containing protein n=1 Tax=Dictyobacter kobayashii TaxID=2014872 RepID=A0A402AYI1_9CHLR|nr:DUF2357 domain-containing protein [Dictyobacter kobayashii]GCE24166.1 hypothetical protein KDK_79660 [Dictyobacter kobayashii]